MSTKQFDVLIIGAGLTGLALNYYLRKSGLNVHVLEARNRLGGRVYTNYAPNLSPIEYGATWFGKKHQLLVSLLNQLDLEFVVQELGETAIYEHISTSPHQIVQLPQSNEPSYRILGGSHLLIDALVKSKEQSVSLNQTVQSVEILSGSVLVKTQTQEFQASRVVFTLPPNLLASAIQFRPSLPDGLLALCKQTHTWMGESIKFGLRYSAPFWKEGNLSGTLMSNVGPIQEMYDHSHGEHFGLKGFLNGSYHSISKKERESLILNQLQKYYGKKVLEHLEYLEYVWSNDAYTYASYDEAPFPHQNNGHEGFHEGLFSNKLFIAGSETAPQHPGYMEGAVSSAQLIFQKLQSILF